MDNKCMSCGRELTPDDKGLHRKLHGKFGTGFMCIDCNAAHYNVTRRLLEQKIKQWREMGYGLFAE